MLDFIKDLEEAADPEIIGEIGNGYREYIIF